jgi:putative hydrolase of the HAD superfamily
LQDRDKVTISPGNIRAVLFDLDDTLFDRKAAQSMALELIVKRFPHIFGRFEKERVIGAFLESDRLLTLNFDAGASTEGIREERSRIFLEILDIKEDIVDTITEIYVRGYPRLDSPVPGATGIVKELSARFQIGVVSNGLPDVQYTKLESIGLRDLMSCIVLSEEIGIRKPDPRIFHHAAGLIKIPPADCLYVGNSYTDDIAGAKAAGMLACWLKRSHSSSPGGEYEADFVIGNLKDLTGILL